MGKNYFEKVPNLKENKSKDHNGHRCDHFPRAPGSRQARQQKIYNKGTIKETVTKGKIK